MSLVLRILVVLFIASLFIQCSKNAKNTNGGRANTQTTDTSRPGDPGRVEGDDPPAYLAYKRDLPYLQTIEPPQIRLAFRGGIVPIPAGAKDAVTAHWKEAIKYYYNDYFDKPKDASEIMDREDKWENFCRETDKKLEDVSISAPDGSRYLTNEEARDIHNFLNQAAIRIVGKVKSVESQ